MKKLLSILLAITMALSLCACGKSEVVEESQEEEIVVEPFDFDSYVKELIYEEIYNELTSYVGIEVVEINVVHLGIANSIWNSDGGSTYKEATGNITVSDKFGDLYSGNFTVVWYIDDDGEIRTVGVEDVAEELYKQ